MDVTVVNRQRKHAVGRERLGRFVRRVANEVRTDGRAVTLCLVSDRSMRELNRRFRGKDVPTDVLSFPAGEAPVEDEPHLGDIVIAVPVAARQARERGHTLARELELLALHGFLHLAGYDHETDGGTMRRLERRVARRLLGS
jgi:probable rRNA maturation factor